MLYIVNFVVDTGYEFQSHTCVVVAQSEEQVHEYLRDWERVNLKGERMIVDADTEIVHVPENSTGVVWSTYTKS